MVTQKGPLSLLATCIACLGNGNLAKLHLFSFPHSEPFSYCCTSLEASINIALRLGRDKVWKQRVRSRGIVSAVSPVTLGISCHIARRGFRKAASRTECPLPSRREYLALVSN
jgi:hypothetical protein